MIPVFVTLLSMADENESNPELENPISSEEEVISPELAELLDDPKFLDQLSDLGDKVQTQTIRQYIVHHHYAFIYLYDEANVDKVPGKWLQDHALQLPHPISGDQTACWVKQYEFCFAITFGDQAFAEYGNNARMLSTIDVVLNDLVKPLNYQQLGCFACDAQYEAAVQVKAHQADINVPEESFSEQAGTVYKRIYDSVDDKQKQIIRQRLQAGS